MPGSARAAVAVAVVIALALGGTTASATPAMAAEQTRAAGGDPPPVPSPPSPPELEVAPTWSSISSAYLSPQAAAAGASTVTNAANAKVLMKVGIRRPRDEVQSGVAGRPLKFTQLRIFTPIETKKSQLVDTNGRQLMAIDSPFKGKFDAVGSALAQVCAVNTISPTDIDSTTSSITCRVDPAKWGDRLDTKPTATTAQSPPLRGNGGGADPPSNQAASDNGQKTILIALGGYDKSGRSDDAGATRAANLDAWLTQLAGEQLKPETDGTATLNIPDAVQLVPMEYDPSTNTTKRDETLTVARGSLGWDQCFVKADGSQPRTTCRPQGGYSIVFAQTASAMPKDATQTPTPGGGGTASSLAQDMTSNQSAGTLVPGKRWNGQVTLTNQSQLRGWAGPSPFGADPDPAPAGAQPGYSTEYVFTDLAPGFVTDAKVGLPAEDAWTKSDCRQPSPSSPATAVRAYFPDAIGRSGMVCAVGEMGGFLQPMLFKDASRAQAEPWNPTSSGATVGQFGYNVGYDVPIDFLEKAANDPAWTEVPVTAEQWKYVDENGQNLDPPVKETVTAYNYESTVAPAVWAWVPKACAKGGQTGDTANSVVCAAQAAPNTLTAADQAPASLELVKVATADSFVRRVCSLCWPSPKTVSAVWTNPDARANATRLTQAAAKLRARVARAAGKNARSRIRAQAASLEAQAASLEAQGAAANTPSAGNSAIMQGQHGFLAVTTTNASQTPGYWSRVKIVVDDVPAGAMLKPDRATRIPTDGKKETSWPASSIDDWVKDHPSAFQCSQPDPVGMSGRWECTITASEDPALKDNKGDLGALGLPERYDPGTYAFMFRVAPGLTTKAQPDDGAPYNLKISTQYPNFKHGEGVEPFGSADADAVFADFQVIPEAEALVGLAATQANPDFSATTSSSPKWVPYSGTAIEIGLTNDTPEDPAVKPPRKVHLRYEVTNQGPRWIRPGDEIRMEVKLPAGVDPGDASSVSSNYDIGHDASTKLEDFGEKWSCPTWTKQDQESPAYGFQFTWTQYTLECAATVSSKRTDGGFMSFDPSTNEGRGPNTSFPGLDLTLTGSIQSPTDDDKATATVSVYRGIAPNDTLITAPVETNPNAQSKVPIRVIDPDSSNPTIQPYWLVRPVAGGHATARIDVANINRGAAADMNVLLALSERASFEGEFWKSSRVAGSLQDPDLWTCLPVQGDSRRATCRYNAGLAASRGVDPEHPLADASRTAPLVVTAKIDPAATGTLQMSMDADVFAIKTDAAIDGSDGGLSYMVGAQIRPEAKTLSAAAISQTAVLDNRGAQAGNPVGFEGAIDQPATSGATIQLDAAGSQGPFAGQPTHVKWTQVCVAGQPVGAEDCSTGTAPAVVLKPSADVLNPAFVAPEVGAATTFRFKVDVSDPMEPTDTIQAAVKQVQKKGGGLVDVTDPSDTKVANSSAGYVDVSVSAPLPAAATSAGRQAGTDGTDSGAPKPVAPIVQQIEPGDARFTVIATVPGAASGPAIERFEYSTDDGRNWAPAQSAGPIVKGTGSLIVTSESVPLEPPSQVGSQAPAGSPGPSPTPTSYRPLANGTDYQVRVRAVGAEGPGDTSDQVSVTPQPSAAATPSATPTQSPPVSETPSATPTQSPPVSETPSATPTQTPPRTNGLAPSEACKAMLTSAEGSGFVFDRSTGDFTDAGVTCQVSNGAVKFGDWLTLSGVSATLSATELKISQGNAALPAAWKWPSGTPLTVATAIDVPIGGAAGTVTGTIRGAGMPFGITDVVEKIFESGSTEFAFANGPGGKPKATVAVAAQNGDKKLTIGGPIDQSGKFELTVSAENLFTLGDPPVRPTLTGTIRYDRTSGAVTWDASVRLDNITIQQGGLTMVLAITVAVDSTPKLTVVGDLTFNGIRFAVQGSLDEGFLTIKGSATNVTTAGQPFNDWPLDLSATIEYGFDDKSWRIDLSGTAVGEKQVTADDHLKLASPEDAPIIRILVSKADENSGWNLEQARIGMRILVKGAGSSVLDLAAGADMSYGNKGFKFAVTAQQSSITQPMFEITDGVFVSGMNFNLGYDGTQPPVGGVKPPATWDAGFSARVTVSVPGKDSAQWPRGGIDASYDKRGLFFRVTGSNLPWEIASGATLSDLEFAYQSFKADYQPQIMSANGQPMFPAFKGFQGLVALGAVTREAGKNDFLYEQLKFSGKDPASSKIGGYVRVDNVAGEFEAAVMSDGTIPVFGDPGAAEASLGIDKPYLKVSYAAPDPVGKPNEKSLTVALGGLGKLRYQDASAGGDGYALFSGLSLGASLDLTKGEFAGSLKFTAPWSNAGGIQGLTINKAAIDIGVKNDGQNPPSKQLSASFFAEVTAGDGNTMPGFLNAMGYQSGTKTSIGFAMGKNWCAKLSIGQADKPDVALRPFSFAGSPMDKALEISYANFVYVSSGASCVIGGETLTGTGMILKGSVLKVLPINVNLQAAQKGGSQMQLASPAGGNPVDSAPLGPATVDEGKVDIALDTSQPPASGRARGVRANGPGGSINISGSMPIGGKKVTVSGSVGRSTRQGAKPTAMVIGLGAQLDASDSIGFGKFKIYGAKADVKLEVDPVEFQKTKKLDVDAFSMGIGGDAEVLGSRFKTSLAVDYAGGNVQRMSGEVYAQGGVKVGNNILITGGGKLVWDTVLGLAVTIGDPSPTSGTSFSYCSSGVETRQDPTTKINTTACKDGGSYSFTNAYIDVSPIGFAASGTLTIGGQQTQGKTTTSTFTGKLSGAYYVEDAPGRPIILNGQTLTANAKAGDFAFGVGDATINLPTGQTTASLGVASYTDGNNNTNVAAQMAFEIPMLGGKVAFKGDYDTVGLYDIGANAVGLKIGGFTLDKGTVRVRNYTLNQGIRVPEPTTTVDVDVQATLASWGVVAFTGKHGVEDSVVGTRIKGSAQVKFSTAKTTAAVSYSSFPRDAGFGFFASLSLPGPVEVQVGGVFRKVAGSEELMYRAGGGVTVPIFEGVSAVGTVTMDNCIDKPGSACAEFRRTGAEGNITPQIRIAAGVDVGGGLATAAVEGIIGFDGAFRLIGSAHAGVSMGPWGFFGIITAEAGFSMSFGVCIANTIATARASDKVGCGPKLDMTWVVGLDGKAWAGVTINLWLFKFSINVHARLAGVVGPNWSKYCAVFAAFGFDITFGTCPAEGEIPQVNPSIKVNEYV